MGRTNVRYPRYARTIAWLVAGLLTGFFLPHSWLFRESDYEHSHTETNNAFESWACPMLCVVLDHPGLCPVCGMELEPFVSTGTEVVLSKHDQEMIGLTIGEATHRDLTTGFSAPGVIEFNESGLYSVSAWIGGRIDRLHVTYTGQMISAGESIAEIYSPELYTAQQELLTVHQLDEAPYGSRVVIAEEKLRLMGVSDHRIREITRTGYADPVSEIESPAEGTVTEILVREGEYVSQGQIILKLANISTVWLTVYLTEDQSGFIGIGHEMEFRLDSRPGVVFSGLVGSVEPFMNQAGGSFRARILLENGNGEFLPGQSASTRFVSDRIPGSVLSVPRNSVLSLGERSMVYVMTAPTVYSTGDDGILRIEEARFQPIQVSVGRLAADSTGRQFYPVLEGLKDGDIVALEGSFLIDSQAELLGLSSLFRE